jgi:hypothetical protein
MKSLNMLVTAIRKAFERRAEHWRNALHICTLLVCIAGLLLKEDRITIDQFLGFALLSLICCVTIFVGWKISMGTFFNVVLIATLLIVWHAYGALNLLALLGLYMAYVAGKLLAIGQTASGRLVEVHEALAHVYESLDETRFHVQRFVIHRFHPDAATFTVAVSPGPWFSPKERTVTVKSWKDESRIIDPRGAEGR